MILGFIIPNLFLDKNAHLGLGAIAIPFLAGYAVEPMFAALDNIVLTFRDAVSRNPVAGAAKASSAPRALMWPAMVESSTPSRLVRNPCCGPERRFLNSTAEGTFREEVVMRALSLGLGILGLGLTLSGRLLSRRALCVRSGMVQLLPYMRCGLRPAAATGRLPRAPGYGPPPPRGYAPPPLGYPPPSGYSPPVQSAAPPGVNSAQQQSQLAKANNPTWCASHARKCEELRERFGMTPAGNDAGPQQSYGPPATVRRRS